MQVTLDIASWYLPPANEVWGKIIISQARVQNSVHGEGGACPRCGVPAPGGGGCLVPGVGGGGCLVPVLGGRGGGHQAPSSDGYCCRRYASYWNAFFFTVKVPSWYFTVKVPSIRTQPAVVADLCRICQQWAVAI